MKGRKWLTIILVIQFILFSTSIFYLIPQDYAPYFIGQYILLMVLFGLFSKSKGLIILISYILLTSGANLFIGFIKGWELTLQYRSILYHMTLTLNAYILYSSAHFAKVLEQENKRMKRRIKELTRHVENSRLLTKEEFKNRRELIIKAMERRGEQGYLIYFSVEKANDYTRKAVFDSLTNLAGLIFRSEYDLVGKWNDYSFVVLLQNTNEKGMTTAINRYFTEVNKNMNLREGDLVYDLQVIGGKGEEVISA